MNAFSDPTMDPGSSNTGTPEYIPPFIQSADSPRLSWYRSGGLLNERRAHRVAFPEVLHVVGLDTDADGKEFVAASNEIIARGRDISVDGLSFCHACHIPHRYVAVSFRSPFGTQTLVVKLLWCRFVRENDYTSGGQLVTNPAYNSDIEIDWNRIESSS